jgi:hypothetical protein
MPIQESFFSKAKRNTKRAFDFRSDESIRRSRDLDETNSNLDFMLKRVKPVEQPARKKPVVEQELDQRKKNLEDTGISGGLASNAAKSSGIKGHFQEQAAATPAVKLFKRIGKKKSDNMTA